MDYDVVVIGAGIHGAGAAQAAAAAGYKTLVLEQYPEPARGTSSRSSKLIHGGLRYLETGQFHLVWECLHERALLLQNAPHLVHLVPFYIPVFPETRRRPWKIALGLAIYSLFSRKPFYFIPKHRWNGLDGLRTNDLQALFSYFDAQTDDARLTRAVLASAASLGTEIYYQARFGHAEIDDHGCTVNFATAKGSRQIKTRVVINTAGPWANEVLAKITPRQTPCAVELIQGTHIQIPGHLKHIYYLEAPQDQRAVFIMPWRNNILVGTTETPYQGDPAGTRPLPHEIEYLLTVYNHYFKPPRRPEDIQGSFAGLRVLPVGEGGPFSRPRDTIFWTDRSPRPRLVTLYGGKLTAYRATAAKLVKMIKPSLPACKPVANTSRLMLPAID